MAIAFDAASRAKSGAGDTSVTVSHTCTGSDLILFATVDNVAAGDTTTGVTYNGVAMTLIGKVNYNATDNCNVSMWYLINPDTGTHNLVASRSVGASRITVMGASYTGAKQSGVPDAYDTATSASSTVASLTKSVTTVADNCWVVYGVGSQSNNASAGSGSTLRTTGSVENAMFDSNGVKTPAGSYSMTVNLSPSETVAAVIASFAPAVAAAGSTSDFFQLF